jgi:membrane protease YdiL (CAAX protease family)
MKLFKRTSPTLNAIVISLCLLLWLTFFPLAPLFEAIGFHSELSTPLSETISRLLMILWAWYFLQGFAWGRKICKFQFHHAHLAWIFLAYAFLQLNEFFNLWLSGNLILANRVLFVTQISLQIVTGAVEEFIFRGVILLAFLHPQATHKDILRGVTISSLAFGLSHLINLLALNWTIVLPMVIFTTFFGVALAALLLRSGSLWLCIACHALLNVTGEIASYLGSPISVYPVELPPAQIIGTILFTVPALLYGFWLLRKPSLTAWVTANTAAET